MRFTVNLCTYANTQMLLDSVNSLNAGSHEMVIYLHLHSDKPDMVAICQQLAQRPNVKLFNWGFNRGVGQSTNDTLIDTFTQGYDLMIDSQDDLTWGEGDLIRLVEYAAAHPYYYCIQTMGQNGNRGREGLQYRAAAFTRVAWEHIGLFDENYLRAYWEDVDYEYRAALLGLEMGTLKHSNVWHFGSATLANDPELAKNNHAIFEGNRAYYERKWGGERGREWFKTPFNIGWLTPYIGPAKRLRPYDEYDRNELQEATQ